MGNQLNQNQLFTSKCRFSSRLSLVRPSLLRLSPPTPSTTSRPRSKTRRASLLISKDSSSLASSSRTAAPSPTTTSRRSPLSILFSVSVVASEAYPEDNQNKNEPLSFP